jgi:hypothetical protein
MRSYIASFNALRAKIPDAFPEQTLSHLFLQPSYVWSLPIWNGRTFKTPQSTFDGI